MTCFSEEPLVVAVVVNYNACDLLRECLKSLCKQDYTRLLMVVVDNASTDGSREMLGREFPRVTVLKSETNLGFGEACNRGIRHALGMGANWVFLFNNDAKADPACLSSLVRSATEHGVSLVGPKVLCYTPPDVIWSAGGRISLWMGTIEHLGLRERDRGQHDSPREVDYLTACALLVERAVFERIGGLDPAYYPAYVEDVDFCFRARRSGYGVLYEPGARAWHRISASSGGGVTPLKVRLRLIHTMLFFSRYARWYHWPTLMLGAAVRGFVFLAQCAVLGRWSTLEAVGRGALQALERRRRRVLPV